VNAPHDMLIHQELSPLAEYKMGYYFRNDGWYRKHFELPAEWKVRCAVFGRNYTRGCHWIPRMFA
jgi:hypothetical protein